MRTTALRWRPEARILEADGICTDATFALYFGPNHIIADPAFQDALRAAAPRASLVGCTTGTVIDGASIEDDAGMIVAVRLDRTRIRLAKSEVTVATSRTAGEAIGRALAGPDLAGILLLCDSLNVDGSELVEGLRGLLPPGLPISGGLASDGSAFVRTLVGADSMPAERVVAALGFYGDAFSMSQGCAHGWDDFGPPRRITSAHGPILSELDGKPALALYEHYLGDEAQELPASALRYPLLVSDPRDPTREVVRTVLNVDREAGTLIFASSLQEGWSARLMRGAFKNLTEGAGVAARQALDGARPGENGLALLVSCVGRRIVMGQHTEDETEIVASTLSPRFRPFGFYSHGEISAISDGQFCGLHNQTMTVVTLQEEA